MDSGRAGNRSRIHMPREFSVKKSQCSSAQARRHRTAICSDKRPHDREHLFVGFHPSQHNFWNPFAHFAVEVRSGISSIDMLSRLAILRAPSRS
jgi:hypothetical protein